MSTMADDSESFSYISHDEIHSRLTYLVNEGQPNQQPPPIQSQQPISPPQSHLIQDSHQQDLPYPLLRHKQSRSQFDTQRLENGSRIDQLKFGSPRYDTSKLNSNLLEQLQALKLSGTNYSPTGTMDSKRIVSASAATSAASTGTPFLSSKKSRSKLPTVWFDEAIDHHPTPPLTHGRDSSGDDDDVIPTAIVIKNIPFNVKREQLLDIISSLGIPVPYAFNYHFDNGVFRGLAFANFRTAEETDAVVVALNGYEVQGRKLRVEYKKVLPAAEKERIEREKAIKRLIADHVEKERMAEEERILRDLSSFSAQRSVQELDLNDPETLQFYSRVLLFKGDKNRGDEMIFPSNLGTTQRRILHLIAQKLGLYHYSQGEGDERHVVITRNPTFGPGVMSPQPPIGQRPLRTQRSFHSLGPRSTQQRNLSAQGGLTGSNTFSGSTTSGPVRKSLHTMRSMSDLHSSTSSKPSSATFATD